MSVEPMFLRAKSTDRYMILSVISSQSEGLGKMALGIVKIYLGSPFSANRRCSRSLLIDIMQLSALTVQHSWYITLPNTSPPDSYFKKIFQ